MVENKKAKLSWLNKTTSLLLIPLLLLALTPTQVFADYYYAGWILKDSGGSSVAEGIISEIRPTTSSTIVAGTTNIASWVNNYAGIYKDYVQLGWYNGSGIAGTSCGSSSGSMNIYFEIQTDSGGGGRQCSVLGTAAVGTWHTYRVNEGADAGNGRFYWYAYLDGTYKGSASLRGYQGDAVASMESWSASNEGQSNFRSLQYLTTSSPYTWTSWPNHTTYCKYGTTDNHDYFHTISDGTDAFTAISTGATCY